MSVTPESLNNAERDLGLMNRETKGGRKASAAVAPSAEEQLIALRQRIAEGLAAHAGRADSGVCRLLSQGMARGAPIAQRGVAGRCSNRDR
jgi:hypothetical protein